MALQDELREQLIKQFETDVMILREDSNGKEYYACPSCRRHVGKGDQKCPSCNQTLKWDNIRQKELEETGVRKATVTFEIPGDFSKSDCRKCPLSYIARRDEENVYECPLNMRKNCPLELL